MTSSRLRKIPDELIIPDKNNGGVAKLLGTGVLECHCGKCDAVFWMKSSIAQCCPSCKSRRVKQVWTTPQVAFIPENYEK